MPDEISFIFAVTKFTGISGTCHISSGSGVVDSVEVSVTFTDSADISPVSLLIVGSPLSFSEHEEKA